MYKNKRRSSNEKQLGDVIEKLLKAYNLEDKMKELQGIAALGEDAIVNFCDIPLNNEESYAADESSNVPD